MSTIKRIILALLPLLMLALAACDDEDEPQVARLSISSHATGSEVTVLATGEGDVSLFINGQPVDNPHTIARDDEPCTVTAYATAKDGDNPMARSEVYNVEIPALSAATQPDVFTVNGVKFKMVAVDGGTFMMGATGEQGSDAGDDELPVHQVTLLGYAIGQTEVTQELWQAVTGTNPSHFSARFYYTENLQRPVEYVSWEECQAFISKLNNITGMVFRLPTEAEWEFAARGGAVSQGYIYAGSNVIDEVAWFGDSNTHPVAAKAPNELGLFDMSGNVWEWCHDWKGEYPTDAQANPNGPQSGTNRVTRGGSWSGDAAGCRVSNRNSAAPTAKGENLGLRLAI